MRSEAEIERAYEQLLDTFIPEHMDVEQTQALMNMVDILRWIKGEPSNFESLIAELESVDAMSDEAQSKEAERIRREQERQRRKTNRVEKLWARMLIMIGPIVDERTRVEMRRFFYSGADSLFAWLMLRAAAPTPREVEEIADELNAWRTQLAAEVAEAQRAYAATKPN